MFYTAALDVHFVLAVDLCSEYQMSISAWLVPLLFPLLSILFNVEGNLF